MSCFPDEYSQTKKLPANVRNRYLLVKQAHLLGKFILFSGGFHLLHNWLGRNLVKETPRHQEC